MLFLNVVGSIAGFPAAAVPLCLAGISVAVLARSIRHTPTDIGFRPMSVFGMLTSHFGGRSESGDSCHLNPY